MTRFIKAMSYGFSRNLGRKDRIIRAIIAITVLASWIFGAISGAIGIVLGVMAIMILGTAASARCSICYIVDKNTISPKERQELKNKGIRYEQ